MGIPEFQSRDVGGMLGRAIGEGLGGGLQRGMETALPIQFQRGLLHNALQQAKATATAPNANPLNTLFSTIEALAGIPGSERYAAQILPMIQQYAQANASQNAPVAGQGGLSPTGNFNRYQPGVTSRNINSQNRSSSQYPTNQQGNLPSPVTGERIYPSNVGPQEEIGNLPQEATTGVKVPVYSRPELIAQAGALAAQKTAAGIPTTKEQALEELNTANEQNKVYNQEVDKELKNRTESQKKYGEMGIEELGKYFNNGEINTASPELQSLFREKGIELASRGKNDAQIRTSLATEAKNLKNTVSNIEKQLSAPRLMNSIGRKFKGTYQDFQSASKSLREKVKPLLDLGQYDLARNLLEKIGYYPEEREMIINPLDERTISTVNNMAKVKQPFAGSGFNPIAPVSANAPALNSPEIIENLKSNIVEVFKNNPNVSLVLLRKAVEDKGYNWIAYKNSINDLSDEGKISLSEDQKNQSVYLDTPPLNELQKILHGINIIGR